MKAGMHAPSLYLDTSVIGGYYDPEFMADTRRLWELQAAGRFRFHASQLGIAEAAKAPPLVRALVDETFLPEAVIAITPEMETLAQAYLKAKVVPPRFADDALHVAACIVSRLDYLVSWNFKHLTNLRRETGFNAVNLLQGYPAVRIVAPTFLIHGQDEKSP